MSELLKQTPSQTVGPYFAYGLTAEQYRYPFTQIASGKVADDTVPGTHIRIVGRIFDGEGKPVPDAMVEIWQADGEGRYAHPADSSEGARGSNTGFKGFGRQGTGVDPENRFHFETVKPGSVGEGEAPHITVIVFMRGLLTHAYTRIYFADEAERNAADPVLQSVPEERRATLLAEPDPDTHGLYRFDIHMQGEKETVFFNV
ncbi:protocatechuate 3,4-dioxygenase subunit alpha [Afifella sp. IM 167]|uniref:protocatechuate 3,4-dioxygenase subunit alpha n=1 Tax=Afifella sp. IM 167 TaxID=2033586 RepID=UPI001CCDCD02|nr:protocatechuate 3,4-dioxygenase subunit alpha [Afifella sp. IM 167]MBZ8132124.1 protocatechuate 3,4-dioxygenase subunit alpha [Afifella sp. IM 167]